MLYLDHAEEVAIRIFQHSKVIIRIIRLAMTLRSDFEQSIHLCLSVRAPSAHGVLCPKDHPRSAVAGVRIEFDAKGKAAITAKKGFEFIKPRLEKAKGNPCCIAEFAFGTNPCGNMLLATEKAYGTCHVAIGQNTWLGGKNRCSPHWDFLVEKPTVTLNGKLVLRNGKFIV